MQFTVHPRVGGERQAQQTTRWSRCGSSPRGRGTQPHPAHATEVQRFIPAWAGNALHVVGRDHPQPVHPRVGGERSSAASNSALMAGSSPRGRGTLVVRDGGGPSLRFIPAWAGNAVILTVILIVQTVHPRVGGERVPTVSTPAHNFGSSPRGRGTPYLARVQGLLERFIPAWAGNALVCKALVYIKIYMRQGT